MEIVDIVLSLIALTILEVILGIDNLIMLSIITEKLPLNKRKKARHWGLTFSWVTRLILLGSAVYLVSLTQTLFSIGDYSFSARDVFLILGGMFLLWKATDEIHKDIADEPNTEPQKNQKYSTRSFGVVIAQVALMDIIFSLDSVLTAIGLTKIFWIMAVAITIAILIMIYASQSVGEFINRNPTIKILALSYLLLIGTLLIADGFSFHIPRAYLYFSMGFSLAVEALNTLRRAKRTARKS